MSDEQFTPQSDDDQSDFAKKVRRTWWDQQTPDKQDEIIKPHFDAAPYEDKIRAKKES